MEKLTPEEKKFLSDLLLSELDNAHNYPDTEEEVTTIVESLLKKLDLK